MCVIPSKATAKSKKGQDVAGQQFDNMGLRGLFGIGFLVMFCGGVLLLLSANIISSQPAYEISNWDVAKWIGAGVLIGGAALEPKRERERTVG